jgi:hypothetical protein
LVQKGFKLEGESTESYLAQTEPVIDSKGLITNDSNINWPSRNSSNDGNNTIRYVFAREDQNIPLWVVEGKADIGVISNVDFEQETYESVKSLTELLMCLVMWFHIGLRWSQLWYKRLRMCC